MLVVRRVLISALALVALATAGCPDSPSGSQAAPAAACAKRGEQCKLADGVLGVCNDVACAAGKDPPCLGCVSQH